MCRFLSTLLVRDGRILFTESNHHSTVIERAGIRDNELFMRHFVRLECPLPHEHVEVDEQGTLPEWYVDNFGEVLVLDDLLPRMRAIADAVTKLRLDRNAAYEKAADWQREEKERIKIEQCLEHPWLYPYGEYEAAAIKIGNEKCRREAAADERYRVGFHSLNGYLPPDAPDKFLFNEDTETWFTSYSFAASSPQASAQWLNPPSISFGSFGPAVITAGKLQFTATINGIKKVNP